MDNNIEAAFEKAAESTGKSEVAPAVEAGKQEILTPKPEEASTQDSGKVEPSAPAPEAKPEWNGDVNALPPELQKWAKAAQRKLTAQAMADAELRRKGQEYEQVTASDTWKKYQESLKQPAAAPQQIAEPGSPTSGITAQEWEEAQLDSSGQVAQKLISREVQRQINEAAQTLVPQIQQLQQDKVMTAFNTALSDFSDIHPDVIQLHQIGLMRPFLEEELKSGKHTTHQSAIQAAYERAAQIQEKAEQLALQRTQGRILEKQNAVTLPTATAGDMSVVEVDKADAFDKAFEFALEKKHVKVKARR